MWMGVFWIALGVFFLLSSFLGKGGFIVPALQINLGWLIVPLGALRIWWWWKTEEEPRRQKAAFRAEVRKIEQDAEDEKRLSEAEKHFFAGDKADKADKADEPSKAKD